MGSKLLLLPIFLITIWGVKSQSIKFEHYNDDNGLSHNSVRHIVQDNNGFLWVGTFSGLNRFDGYEFESYVSTSNVSNTIPNDDITALELDEEQNHLWIGTRNGLTLFDTGTHTFSTFLPDVNDPTSLQDKEIRSVLVDRFKQVWVGTKDRGVYVYIPKQKDFKKIELPGFNYVKEIIEDSYGHIWLGSYESAGVAKISLDDKGNILPIFENIRCKFLIRKKLTPIPILFMKIINPIFLSAVEVVCTNWTNRPIVLKICMSKT